MTNRPGWQQHIDIQNCAVYIFVSAYVSEHLHAYCQMLQIQINSLKQSYISNCLQKVFR